MRFNAFVDFGLHEKLPNGPTRATPPSSHAARRRAARAARRLPLELPAQFGVDAIGVAVVADFTAKCGGQMHPLT